jgi:CYTH domain-containing protein/8-oxo-dGTP pyrophosphatase MutT (NUDIX family)
MAWEIERKFLVGELPDEARGLRPTVIRQGYLAMGGNREVRLRQVDKRFLITAKSGTGLQRLEYETTCSAAQFEALWPGSEGQQISKERYRINLSGLIADLDVFYGPLSGLKLVEVEFPDRETAAAFEAPYWFGPEVTGDSLFSNATLSTLTGPNVRKQLGAALDPPIPALGAIPFLKANGQLQVVVVSTRAGNRWIFPKGGPEPHLTAEAAALSEAAEEAGVAGVLVGSPIPAWFWRDRQCYRIDYWPMDVQAVWPRWQEDGERKRKICLVEEARGLLENASMSRAMDLARIRIGRA